MYKWLYAWIITLQGQIFIVHIEKLNRWWQLSPLRIPWQQWPGLKWRLFNKDFQYSHKSNVFLCYLISGTFNKDFYTNFPILSKLHIRQQIDSFFFLLILMFIRKLCYSHCAKTCSPGIVPTSAIRPLKINHILTVCMRNITE